MPEDRPLPYSLDAERAVLGACIVHNPALDRCIENGLTSEQFFLPQHSTIFKTMLFIWEDRSPVDAVTLTEILSGGGKLEASGGAEYIAQLMNGVHRAINVEHYVKIIQEKATLRHLIHAAAAIQEQAFSGDTAAEVLERAQSTINDFVQNQQKRGPVTMLEIVRGSSPHIDKIFNEGKRITGLPTGYDRLDNLTSGLQPSDLIVIAARPSVGKSALAFNIVENVAVRKNIPVLAFSLEMSREALLFRMIASDARVNSFKFRTGHISHEDMTLITESMARLAASPIWVDDSSAASLLEIAARARRIKHEHGLSLVVIDYLQLIAVRGGRSRQDQVSEISAGLKALAKDLAVPVIALSQLTRAPEREDRRPQLSDLRDSGSIEQDADVVMFIHRPNMQGVDKTEEERAKTEIIIAKQRNGPIGDLDFVFLHPFTRFEEAADIFSFGE